MGIDAVKEDGERKLADHWREYHGQNNWDGLLDPFDPLLRAELTRYGEMAQACYDAFDYDPYSKYCGSCKYPRDELFVALEMEAHGYEVTRYLYATSNVQLPNFFRESKCPDVWSQHSNWIGFVAVSNDEMSKKLGRRDIAICWRGTVTRVEWVHDWMVFLKPISAHGIPCLDPTVKVEGGFVELYTNRHPSCRYSRFSVREQVLSEVKHLVEVYTDEEVSISTTGHSLGSALATLSAYDIVDMGLNVGQDGRVVPVSVFSFAGPRVGNMRFKSRLEGLGVKVLRVVNVRDVVPQTPGVVLNEKAPLGLIKLAHAEAISYSHVGVELTLDQKDSPYLKETDEAGCAHDLEAYLHLLDGYHGKGREFELATGRDIALVNKSCDFLKDEYLIPPCWHQEENKGMIKSNDGRWILRKRSELVHDDHPDHTHHRLRQLGLSPN